MAHIEIILIFFISIYLDLFCFIIIRVIDKTHNIKSLFFWFDKHSRSLFVNRFLVKFYSLNNHLKITINKTLLWKNFIKETTVKLNGFLV